MQTDKTKWEEFTHLVLESIDIQATCESWGLVFTGKVSANGWAECHGMNREDRHASAAVNLGTGYYKDHGPGPSYPLFRLGTVFGPYATYHECLDDLAKQNKLLSKKPKSKSGSAFYSRMKWKKWNPLACRNLCKELNITQDILELVGGTMGVTNAGDMAVVFPVYDAKHGFEAAQKGVVCINANGGKLTIYQGKGKPDEHRRTNSIGEAGIMNKNAIQYWHQSQVIYKVEGISDMLSLQALIPEGLRKTHLVVTNSDGCDAKVTAEHFADMAKGKNIVIVHDADEPGQFGTAGSKTGGAARWESCCLVGGANTVINLQLPYEIAPKKGKDLRDWIAEGHTYQDLVELVKTTPVSRPSRELEKQIETGPLSEHQKILKDLGLIVFGHTKDGKIQVFNAKSFRKFQIPDIDRFSYAKQLVHIGQAAVEQIADPHDHDAPDDLIDSNDVRVAIAREAGGKELSRTNTVGIGIWESSGRMFAIGTGEWIAANGGVDIYNDPMIDDKIVEFGEMEEEWYDTEKLFDNLELAKSPEWRVKHLNELSDLFGRWKNHTHPIAGTVMACLVIGTWAQTVWDWRPWIAVTGESSTGKTAMMGLLAGYFGKLCVATANASEAGIRNTIGTSSRILMLDEFENSKHRSAIIEMLMSSNRRGRFGVSLRSNAAQGSVTSEYQLMPWFSATEMKKDKQTEANRYITFELGSRDGMEFFQIPDTEEEFSELRNKSIAVIMRIWRRVKELTSHIVQSMGTDYFRQSESYALVSAIYSAIHGHSDETAANFHRELIEQLRAETVIQDEESEQEMALSAILNSTVQVGGGKLTTVADLLQMERQEGWEADPDKELRTIGIRRVGFSDVQVMSDWRKAKQDGRAVDASYVFLNTAPGGQIRRKLLHGTQHDRMDLTTILKRIKHAFVAQVRLNGPARGVMVPLSAVCGVDSKPFPSVDTDDFPGI